jgi:PEP-CTERM motif
MSNPMKRLMVVACWGWGVFAGFAHAAPFVIGDIFASIGAGQVQHYSAAGVLLETLNTGQGGFTTGSASDAAGNLYVTNFSVGSVSRFTGPGDPHTPSIFAPAAGVSPESILFDAAGNVYVGSVNGDNDVRKFNAAGTLIDQFDVATEIRGSDWIDLAADQRTLFYTSEGSRVLRYDVVADTQLTDFATGLPGSNAFALRLLQGGGLLVADTQSIHRLDSGGNIVQTYDDPGNNNWFALNLDPNGTSFWSGDSTTGELLRFNIATGAVEQTIATGAPGTLFGVSVFGEITVSQPPTGVPEPSSILLGMLALACLAAGRRRKH